MDFFTSDTVKVGFPMNPSEWVGEEERKKVTVIRVDNGQAQYVIVDRFDYEGINLGAVQFLFVKNMNGRTLAINPRYIIGMADWELVRIPYYTMNHNYGEGRRYVEFLGYDGVKVIKTNNFFAGGVVDG